MERLGMKVERLKMEIEYLEWMLDNEEFDCDTIQYIFINLKKLDIHKIIEKIEINETVNKDDQFDDIANDNSSDASSDVSDEDLSDEGKKKRLSEIRDDINETERKILNIYSSQSPDIAENLETRVNMSLKKDDKTSIVCEGLECWV